MSDILARLIEAGTPAALVADVARELAKAELARETLESRGESEAARSGNYRDRLALPDSAWASLRGAVLERDGFVCAYCEKDLSKNGRYVVDHIMPLGRGGTNDLDNLTVACVGCNSSKRDRILHSEWTPPKDRRAK